MRIMFQGRNGMKPGDHDYDAAVKLGELLAAQGHEAIVGAYGGVVRALLESGIRCHGHSHRDTKTVDGMTFDGLDVLDVRALVAEKLGPEFVFPEVIWALRLGVMMQKAEAFVFFEGGPGTVAHLVPVLALNIKRWEPEGRPRKLATVEFGGHKLNSLGTLMDHGDLTHASYWRSSAVPWAQDFQYNHMARLASWLTAPSK